MISFSAKSPAVLEPCGEETNVGHLHTISSWSLLGPFLVLNAHLRTVRAPTFLASSMIQSVDCPFEGLCHPTSMAKAFDSLDIGLLEFNARNEMNCSLRERMVSWPTAPSRDKEHLLSRDSP